jgi:twitching motility protein PilT
MLLTSLLTAMVRADGDALVMHVGERPYVVTSGGHVDLSTSGLALQAMSGMLTQLLPTDAMRGLSEFGAVEHELTPPAGFHDRFTIVAARGGDDIWIEIRRMRQLSSTPVVARSAPEPETEPAAAATAPPEPVAPQTPEPVVPPAPEPVAAPEPELVIAAAPEPEYRTPEPVVALAPEPVVAAPEPVVAPDPEPLVAAAPEPVVAAAPEFVASTAPTTVIDTPEPAVAAAPELVVAAAPEPVVAADPEPVVAPVSEPGVAVAPEPSVVAAPESEVAATPEPVVAAFVETVVVAVAETVVAPSAESVVVDVPEPAVSATPEPVVAAEPVVTSAPAPVEAVAASEEPLEAREPEPVADEEPVYQLPLSEVASTFAGPEAPASLGESASAFSRLEPPVARPEPSASLGEAGSAVVVPLTRPVRIEMPPRAGSDHQGIVERLLSIAGARRASVLYLTSQSRPFIRVEGEIRAIDGEPALTSADVEAAVLELMPERARGAYGRGEPAEWVSEIDGVGRIRCSTFADYRGKGAIFHLISARPMSAEQLGLAREIQALATEAEGLVLVASPRGNGRSTLISALVDQINRNDGGYIISLERQIRIVHENRQSLVSQREVGGTAADAVTIARAALRENPDILVIEDLDSPDVIQLALEAAGSGLLVFLSVRAGSTTSALSRVINLFHSERRKTVQAMLAERLRGAVSQVLLRKVGGGRIAARELLLTTAGVANLIAEGEMAQLQVAIDGGRKLGMGSLNEALIGFLRKGLIEVREAYRKADDRAGLLALLKRDGADTSVVDRLA